MSDQATDNVISITEEDKIHERWFEEAKDREKMKTPDDLIAFMERLDKSYDHDYGTICHAITAIGLASMKVADRHMKQGGITGFQASCIMWGIIQEWMDEKGPMKLTKYEHMLYPQYSDRFAKTLTTETWEWLQGQAKEKIQGGNSSTHSDVFAHWERIANGEIPFGYKVAD